MSFNPPGPGVGPVPGQAPGPTPVPMPGAAPAQRRVGADMLAAGGAAVMLALELVLLAATWLVAGRLGYIGSLFGLADGYIDAPSEFTSWDLTFCAVLVTGAIGCLAGRSWGRPTVLVSMALTAYPALTNIVATLRTGGMSGFTQGHNLWFNLIMVVEFFVAVGTILGLLLAALSSRGTGAGVDTAAGQPVGVPGVPFHAQQQPAPGYVGQPVPPQTAPYAPGAPFPPGPAQPGPVHQGPIQQPTPTQQADAYRPTEYAPRPAQPPVPQPGHPQTPPTPPTPPSA